jgi:hypothetical protein
MSALDHLRRAGRIREVDPEMALFRCITAEEEAVAAIFWSLKRRRYPGAERLQPRSHRQKAIVLPFLKAAAETFRLDGGALPASIVHDKVDGAFRLRVRYLTTAPDGTPVALYPIPPLDGKAVIEGQQPDVLPELLKLAGGADLARLKEAMVERANERNRLLYASEKGLLRFAGPVDAEIARHRNNIIALLAYFVLIDEHAQVQGLVRQSLTAFLAVYDALYPPKPATDCSADAAAH